MSTPTFDPQPCCGGSAVAQDVNVTNTVDVNVMGTVDVADPVDVNVLGTVSVAEPVDVNVLGTVPVSGTVGITGGVTATVAGSTAASATLTAATTGNGSTVDFANAKSNVSLLVQVNGTVTGGTVRLEASQDGTNWVKIADTGQLATGVNQSVSLSGGAYRWFRGTIPDTVTGGGSVTATLMYA